MTLFEKYELMGFILNKDFSGNVITPERFRSLIKVVNISLFKKKFGLPEEYQPGRPIPREFVEITAKNADDLRRFKAEPLLNTPCERGVLPFPENYAHRDQIIYNYTRMIDGEAVELSRQVEVMSETQAAGRRSNYTKRPSLMYPIAVMRHDGFHIFPREINEVDFTYWRWPIDPVFSYHEHAGYITYNASASTEVEWPRDEHLTLVRMMLAYFGVNLREEAIMQYAETKIQQGG